MPEYARKQTKLPKTAADVEKVEGADATAKGGDLRLDLLAKASGFGGSKQDRELEQVRSRRRAGDLPLCCPTLEHMSNTDACFLLVRQQYMSSLRLSTTEGMIEVADSADDDTPNEDEDDDEGVEIEDEDEDDEAEHSGDGTSNGMGDEDEAEESGDVSRADRKAAKAAAGANSSKPSRGAARKALLDGDDSKVAQLVASDRAKAARRAEKHHGRKAHAGKGGRAHAGGKAKTGKARMISDSMDF